MENKIKLVNPRITVVDALRGFALVSIMLLHNIERFEVFGFQADLPQWMLAVDKVIWDTFFFLFGGKSYAIFALLFGLTFYIQTANQAKLGNDFRVRFLWRLFLLIGFGIINTLFYQGEILILYALVGVFIVPFAKLNNRVILIFALFFLLQPILWVKTIIAFNNPAAVAPTPAYMPYYMKVGEFLTGDSMLALMKSNITNGRTASLLWFWEVGRVAQTLGLFLLGFLAGRTRIFFNTDENIRFWKRTLLFSALAFIPLYYLNLHADLFSDAKNVTSLLGSIFKLWSNLALMLILVAGFVLLFYNQRVQPALDKLSPIGKMSLTNYIIQSVVGATIYYGFGLGLYRYTGATYCLLIGIVLAIGQGLFSTYWFKNHKRGPLEAIWHKLTWLDVNKL